MHKATKAGNPVVPILMYHNIAPVPAGLRVYRSLYVSPGKFARQMWLLHQLGYTGLSMSAALPFLRGSVRAASSSSRSMTAMSTTSMRRCRCCRRSASAPPPTW
ncbi:hypothetical protein RLIN73S_01747 [Rhodanobacter lindaniclasticus]